MTQKLYIQRLLPSLPFSFALMISSLLLLFSASSFASADFMQAYDNARQGKYVNLAAFRHHPLFPYLEYEQINYSLDTANGDAIKRYIKKYPDTFMAERLWTHWLSRLAKQNKWHKIIQLYNEDANRTSAKCLYLEARIRVKQHQNQAINSGREIWNSAESLPDECNSLFKLLQDRRYLTKDHVWKRIDLAMEKGNYKLVYALAKKLPNDEIRIARLLASSHRSPNKALRSRTLGKGRYSRRVVAHSIKRLARKNRKKARTRWNSLKRKYPFTAAERGKVDAYLAMRDSINHDKKAISRFNSIPAKYRNDDANVWMARIALREGQWSTLENAIYAMSDEERKRDIWRYWLARAQYQLGDKQSANRLFHELSNDASFYGFLSADRLNKPYSVLTSPEKNKDRSACLDDIRRLPSVQRALAWYDLGEKNNGNREWFWTAARLNKEGKLTLAALGIEIGEVLTGVSTVSRTKDWNQVKLRFPVLYENTIKSMSQANNISPAWAYGIMRRESVFNEKAKSSAKAMGLMQLLPSTARGVARNLGMRFQTNDLYNPNVNIKLGTAYLNQLLARKDGSYIEATASYNAGPNAASRWKPDRTIDADRWVESIPYTETRKYVRAVMSYTTIYDHKLHGQRALRLSQRLSPVSRN